MNKSEIRKKLLIARKLNNNKNLVIKFSNIIKILKKEKINRKIIGGYYPYNHEVDSIQILNKLEKLGYQISLPKIKKNNQMDFLYWSTKASSSLTNSGSLIVFLKEETILSVRAIISGSERLFINTA